MTAPRDALVRALADALRPFAKFACPCGECPNCKAEAALAEYDHQTRLAALPEPAPDGEDLWLDDDTLNAITEWIDHDGDELADDAIVKLTDSAGRSFAHVTAEWLKRLVARLDGTRFGDCPECGRPWGAHSPADKDACEPAPETQEVEAAAEEERTWTGDVERSGEQAEPRCGVCGRPPAEAYSDTTPGWLGRWCYVCEGCADTAEGHDFVREHSPKGGDS